MSKMFTRAVLLSSFVFLAILLLTCLSQLPVVLSTDSPSNEPLVIVIAESGMYDEIATSLQQYKEDVEKSGFSLNITTSNQLLNGTKEGVREYLQRFWRLRNQTVIGALLVGDIAEAWYEVGSNKFPTDVYFMDLNGIWVDTSGNGIYDKHLDTSGPEIWVGRLKVSTVNGDPIDLLKRYFDRNSQYRNQLTSIPWWRTLLYMDDQGVAQNHDARTPLGYIAPQVISVTNGRTTNADDYKQRLQDEVGFQWLYLMSHGNSTYHTFQVPSKETFYEWDGTVYASDYRTLNPHVYFYHFFVCSGGRYVDEDYLAGASVFGNDYGLLAVASTDDTYTFPYDGFYKALSEGQMIGTAFLQWLKNSTADYMRRTSTGLSPFNLLSDSDYDTLLHSMVIIGDPTLRLRIENHGIEVAGVTAAMQNVSGTETLVVSFTVENTGDFPEAFNATVHIDSNLVYESSLMLESKGNRSITFFPKDASKYIWSDFIHHQVRVEVSSGSWEFDVENNVRYEYFVSKIIPKSILADLPEVIFALGGVLFFGLMGWGFLRLLMSDRPLYYAHRGLARVSAWVRTALLRRT
ncbi:MAG TPA: C25 family cysteine peptidase [Candidatus Bathyarchaeia archaeon]|nr:C25 family cysteine peptidase [Candidatus Bathyarchaeia archaeon]